MIFNQDPLLFSNNLANQLNVIHDPGNRPALSLKSPKKQGWMWKEGNGVTKSWKRRFFILEGEYLYFYSEDVV